MYPSGRGGVRPTGASLADQTTYDASLVGGIPEREARQSLQRLKALLERSADHR